MKLSTEQQAVVDAVHAALQQRNHFTLQGLAGSGKTTVAAYIAQSHDGAILCAPTGKAASVLGVKTGLSASTAHSQFYEFVRNEDRTTRRERLIFRRAHERGALRDKVLVLDECSMISREVAEDILATGITIVSIGNPGQLPPVNGQAFFAQSSFTLREIHRQALESPIIRQAHEVRFNGNYAPDGAAFRVEEKLAKSDLLTADIVLTWKRETRSRFNNFAREARGLTSPLPLAGAQYAQAGALQLHDLSRCRGRRRAR
jgi:exodeoxyribonuclease-5